MRVLRGELSVPLYRNAYALMLNTVVNSGFGFLYWIVAAHNFSDAEVGRANALVALMMLVSVLTQVSFGQALIRFLPRGGGASRRLLCGAYGTAAGLSMIGGTAVMAVCHYALGPTDPLHVSLLFGAWFTASTVIWSIFNLQDSALTGLRASMWIPLENGLYGVVKLGLLVVIAQFTIANAVFTSWTAPVLMFLIPVNVLIFRRILPRHVRETATERHVPTRRDLTGYLAGDYAGQVFTQASSSLLPVLVVSRLGAAQGAYFLPAQTIFVALNLLSLGITSSLVVEAATDERRAHVYAIAVLRRIGVTVLPAAVLVALGAPWLLDLFGTQYSANATTLLRLLMASTFPRVVVSLYVTMCRLQRRTGRLAILQLVQAVILVGGTAALAGSLGLVAVGWAALASQAVPAIALTPRVVTWLSQARRADRVTRTP